MLSAVISAERSYPALPRAGQLVYWRFVRDESEALRAQIEKLEKIIGMIGNVFYDDVMRRNGTRPVDLGLAKVIDLPRDSRGHLDREFFGSDFELDNLWRFDG